MCLCAFVPSYYCLFVSSVNARRAEITTVLKKNNNNQTNKVNVESLCFLFSVLSEGLYLSLSHDNYTLGIFIRTITSAVVIAKLFKTQHSEFQEIWEETNLTTKIISVLTSCVWNFHSIALLVSFITALSFSPSFPPFLALPLPQLPFGVQWSMMDRFRGSCYHGDALPDTG